MRNCGGCQDKQTIIDHLTEKGKTVISSCAQCINLRQDLTRAKEAVTEARRLLAEERESLEETQSQLARYNMNLVTVENISNTRRLHLLDQRTEIENLKRTVGEAVSEIDRLTQVIDRLRKGKSNE